ncbi:YidH family protein [Geminocystis sp. CENA526]|uniref:YidH family protein n=1 Tax=Geminocystis sp. CENA526 TaxID=1355871 RepID=UPI003D6E5A4F
MSSSSYNLNNELAKERNRAAAERTLMAWIRTCLSLISFGFGIDRILVAIHQAFETEVDSFPLSRFLGLSFIIIGTLALLMASLSHRQDLKRIDRGDFIYTSRISLSFVVSIALIVVGMFAFIGILIKGG